MQKELWLSDEEFAKVMGVSKVEWGKLPAWKKVDKRKTLKIY